MADHKRKQQGDTLVEERVQKPKRYKVLLFNDDFTTMEFVTFVLQAVFKHSPASAHRLMLAVHKEGVGVAGVYAKEIAETRVEQVLDLARANGHPLQCSMEPE